MNLDLRADSGPSVPWRSDDDCFSRPGNPELIVSLSLCHVQVRTVLGVVSSSFPMTLLSCTDWRRTTTSPGWTASRFCADGSHSLLWFQVLGGRDGLLLVLVYAMFARSRRTRPARRLVLFGVVCFVLVRCLWTLCTSACQGERVFCEVQLYSSCTLVTRARGTILELLLPQLVAGVFFYQKDLTCTSTCVIVCVQ